MVLHNITTHVDLPPERLPGGAPLQGNKKDTEIIYFYSNYRYWILDYAETLINGRGIKEYEDTKTVNDTPIFINDSGYAFLALVNSYFDIIGQLCGSDKDEYDCYRQPDKDKEGRFKLKKFKKSHHGSKNWTKWDIARKAKERAESKPQSDRCIWYGLTFVLYDEYKKFKSTNQNPQRNVDWAKFCYQFYYYTRNPVAHTTFPSKLLITRDPTPFLWGIEKVRTRDRLLINLPNWYKRISDHFDQYVLRIRFPKTQEDRELRKRFLKRHKRIGG